MMQIVQKAHVAVLIFLCVIFLTTAPNLQAQDAAANNTSVDNTNNTDTKDTSQDAQKEIAPTTPNVIDNPDAAENKDIATDTSDKNTKNNTPAALAVKLVGSKKFTLLPTSALDTPLDSVVAVNFSFGLTPKPSKNKKKAKPAKSAKEVNFNALLIADDKIISATVLDDFMMTVGSIAYDGKKCTLDSVLLPKNFKAADIFAAYVISEIQFIYYKADSIAAALAPLKIKLITHTTDGVDYRIVMAKNKSVMQITTKTSDGVIVTSVENYIRKYRYTITRVCDEAETDTKNNSGESTNE